MPLVAELEEPATNPEAIAGARRSVQKVVSTSSDQTEAAFVRSLLDNAGIPSVSEQTPGADSSLLPSVHSGNMPFRLLVHEEDYMAAKEILDQSRSPLLAVSQIEEQLTLFQNQLTSIPNARPDLTFDLDALDEIIERLRSELRLLAERLDTD